jgi:hypothetical protein
MYGALTLGIIMYIGYLFTGSSPPLPTTNLPTTTNNPVVEAINNTAKIANDVANNVANNVANTVVNNVGLGNKPYNKQNNVLENLGGILNTPRRNNQNRPL